MRCKKVLERLDDHVDGLLAAPEAEAVRDHLDRCVDCRETSLALTAASTSLAKWGDAEPPADCFEKILGRIHALPPDAVSRPAARAPFLRLRHLEPVRAARLRWFATSGMAAAAAVLAAVLLSRTEARTVHRFQPRVPTSVASAAAGSWYQGYYFDNDLYYRGQGRPALQPVNAGWRSAPDSGTFPK
jgi:anti-sigma factor RsiW